MMFLNASVPLNQVTAHLNPLGDEHPINEIEIISNSKIYFCNICKLNFRLNRELNSHLALSLCQAPPN